MKYLQIVVLPFLLLNFMGASAQVGGGIIQTPQNTEQNQQFINPVINQPETFLSPSENPDCPVIEIYNRLYPPVNLGFFYDKTNNVIVDRNATFPSQNSQIQVQSTPTSTYIYTDNTTNNFRYHVVIKYNSLPDVGKIRVVSAELISNGEFIQMWHIPVQGLSFCRDFSFWTSPQPKPQTVEDLIGKAGVEAIQQMQYIVPTVNQNTNVVYDGLFMQGIYGGVITLGILFFVFQRFYNQKKKRIERMRELADAKLIHDTVIDTSVKTKQIVVDFVQLGNELTRSMDEKFAKAQMFFDLSVQKIMEHSAKDPQKGKEEIAKIKEVLEKPKEEEIKVVEKKDPIQQVKDKIEGVFVPFRKDKKEEDKRTEDEKLIDAMKALPVEEVIKVYNEKYTIWEKNRKDEKLAKELRLISAVVNEMTRKKEDRK